MGAYKIYNGGAQKPSAAVCLNHTTAYFVPGNRPDESASLRYLCF